MAGSAAASRLAAAARTGREAAVASGSVRDRVAREKSSKRSRRTTVRPARPRRAQPARDPVDEPDERRRRPPRGVAATAAQRALRPDRAAPRARACTGRGSRLCARAWSWRPAARPSSATRVASARRATWPTVVIPRPCSLPAVDRPDAPQPLDRQRVQERELAVGRHHQQPVGLGHAAGHLGQELGAGHPDGDGQADLLAHRCAAAGRDRARASPDTRRSPPTSRNASSIESRSTTGAVSLEDVEHGLAGLGVGRQPRRHDHGLRAAAAAPPPAHRGAHAARPGLVARGQHHPAAHDDRPAAQRRVVALLDGREEGVQVGVEDGRVGHAEHTFAAGRQPGKPRRPAARTPGRWAVPPGPGPRATGDDAARRRVGCVRMRASRMRLGALAAAAALALALVLYLTLVRSPAERPAPRPSPPASGPATRFFGVTMERTALDGRLPPTSVLRDVRAAGARGRSRSR